MVQAFADVEVLPPNSVRAYADVVVDAAASSTALRAYADVTVDPPAGTGLRAYADVTVDAPVPSGPAIRAYADVVVTGRATLPLYRFQAATSTLQPMSLWYHSGGTNRAASLYQFINGQLIPRDAGGEDLLPATTVTATVGNGQVTINWTGVSGATSYKVSRNGIGTNGQGPVESTEASTARTKLFANLANGTAYTFSVQPLPGGPVSSVTVTPAASSQAGVVKPVVGVGGGPEAQQFTPLNVNTNPDRQIGPMLARRSYGGTDVPSTFAQCEAASDVAAGRISCWSFKPSLTLVRSAAFKTRFLAFLDTIPAGHEVRLIAHHEPENSMSSIGGLSAYGEIQNTLADLVHQKNRPELTFGPCWMGTDTWRTTGTYYHWFTDSVNWSNVIDYTKMDFLGIDPYKTLDNTRSYETMCTVNNNGDGSGGSAPSMFAWLTQWDLPISIMEWGWFRKQPEGHGNSEPPVSPFPDATVAPWMTAAYEWIKRWNATHPPRLVNGKVRGSTVDLLLWFNYTLMGSDNPISGYLVSPGPWNQPLKLDAYRKIVADSKISSGVSGAAPVAAFSANRTTGTGPLSVTFTSSSTGSPTSYLWRFSDGVTSLTSTLVNPTMSLPVGEWTVTLTVGNSFGTSVATSVAYVTVTPPAVRPVASFTASPTSGTVPLTVQFSDNSTNGPTSWLWNFGDGTTSTLRNPSRTYTAAGTYTATLTATNSAGSHSASRVIDVTATATDPPQYGQGHYGSGIYGR